MKSETSIQRLNWAASKIQALARGIIACREVRQLRKRLFRRQKCIQQILDTEQGYIRDLAVISTEFRATLLRRRIITQQQAHTIFGNIDSIRQLNELFFAVIFNSARPYSHYKIIFDQVEKQVQFFKLYFEYFQNFPHSNSLIDELLQNNKSFQEYLASMRMNPAYKMLTLQAYLIKPVQRLPRYVLLMKQLRKHTPQDHPDMKNIEKVLVAFEEVNVSNNEKLNLVVNHHKITQIEKKLMIPHVISEPGVEFVLEEPVSVLTQEHQTLQATMYLLNTELIIARKSCLGREKFLLSVPFKNGGGTIMTNQEHYFYRNSFTVQNVQGDSCTFSCQSEEQKQTLIQKIYNQLVKAQQKNLQKLANLCNVANKDSIQFLQKMSRMDMLPEVQVLGTEERSDPFLKYTVYIVEVKIKSIRQKIFMRYSELLDLQSELESQYGVSVKNALSKTTWFTNHKAKTIEQRKISIQKFLKEVLSKQEIVQRGEDVIVKLGLPAQFYKLPQLHKDSESVLKKSAISQRSTNSQEGQSPLKRGSMAGSVGKRSSLFYTLHIFEDEEEEMRSSQRPQRQKSRRISIQDILKANELNLGHWTRYTQIVNQSRSSQEGDLTVSVLIPWLQNQRGFVKQKVRVSRRQTVSCLLQRLANQIDLKYFQDFRLYLQRQYAGRYLDGDESIPKVLNQIHCSNYLLILKKVIYVQSQWQQRQIRNDRIRLKIIASQVIYYCKKDKYLLSYHQILKLSIFVSMAQLFKNKQHQEIEQIIQRKMYADRKLAQSARSMVTHHFTTFKDSAATWQSDFEHNFLKIYGKLQQVSGVNCLAYRSSGASDLQKYFNVTNLSQLAAISIIIQMKQNQFYGSISYIVQVSQWFEKLLCNMSEQSAEGVHQSGGNHNYWLVIKHNSINLYSISLTNNIFSFHYNNICKISTYPDAILIYFRSKAVDYIKLKTTNSYSIRELLTYYKRYNQIVDKIEEDNHFEQSIIELVSKESSQASPLRKDRETLWKESGGRESVLRESAMRESALRASQW